MFQLISSLEMAGLNVANLPIRNLLSKSTNHLISRVPAIQNSQQMIFPENDHIFNKNKPQSDNVDLSLLAQSLQQGYNPTSYILNQLISSCAKLGSIYLGIQVHSFIIKLGFDSSLYINTALVDFYGKSGRLFCARQVFDEMRVRNVVAWNSLISAYMHAGRADVSVELFVTMLRMGIAPTPFSISVILVACSRLEDGEFGILVHCLSVKSGFCYNVVVGTALIDMYSKCCGGDDSGRVFNEMLDRNVITWTSMVTCYAQNKKPDEGMLLVKEMMCFGLRPNHVTYNSLLSSFSSPKDFDHGKQVHCRIIKEGLEYNVYLLVSLMTLYSECSNNLEDFHMICSGVTKWEQISWNALIAGFASLESGDEAFKNFRAMRQQGFVVDLFTFTSIIRATGLIPAIKEGKQIHGLVFKSGYSSNIHVQNGLVSLYARCGAAYDSKRVFFSMDTHDLISWNSLLSGLAHHGSGREAVELFEQMRKTGIKPNSTTYLSVFSACSHVGLVDKGLFYFQLMRNDDLIDPPKAEHYACIVDLYGRAGYLDEAEAFINSMPIMPGPSIFKALLSACQTHGNMDIAKRSAKALLGMSPNDPAIYVLLSHIYTTEGCFDDAAKVRQLMFDRGIKKVPGSSQI